MGYSTRTIRCATVTMTCGTTKDFQFFGPDTASASRQALAFVLDCHRLFLKGTFTLSCVKIRTYYKGFVPV
jgi:hypothetical protein